MPILESLAKEGVFLEGKSFAVGLRIEHPQKEINKIQYKAYADHPALGAANYRLANHDKKTGIGVYSFCMCPGGYVVSSGTESDGIVSNANHSVISGNIIEGPDGNGIKIQANYQVVTANEI